MKINEKYKNLSIFMGILIFTEILINDFIFDLPPFIFQILLLLLGVFLYMMVKDNEKKD